MQPTKELRTNAEAEEHSHAGALQRPREAYVGKSASLLARWEARGGVQRGGMNVAG